MEPSLLIASFGLTLALVSLILTIYYQYWKRGRLRIRYHPKLSDEVHVAKGRKFEGRIEVLNIGNVSTSIYSVSVLSPIPSIFSEVRLEDEFGRRFPIILMPGEVALIRYSLDVGPRPITLEVGFIITSSEKTYKKRLKLIFE